MFHLIWYINTKHSFLIVNIIPLVKYEQVEFIWGCGKRDLMYKIDKGENSFQETCRL